tara:strand:+ start:2973 stop:4157 length:1185 start_codon:yes stop_codon:yes gene_type:complete
MTKENFHEKIALILSFLILNNYIFLSLNFSLLAIKINFLIFLGTIIFFYVKNFSENPYLKIFFPFLVFICLGTAISEWDPRTTWFFHAKRIFYDQSIFSIADNYASHSHNDYPTLAPAFASSLAVLLGYWNEVFPKLSFLLMFLPPLILIYSFLKGTQYLIFLSIVFFTIGKYLFNGWADGLVAIYFGTSAFLIYFLFIENNTLYKKKIFIYFVAFCFFTTLTLIKNEGLVLLLITFLAIFLMKIYYSEFKKDFLKLFILSLSFLPIILWKIFCFSKGIGHEVVNANLLYNLQTRFDDFNNYKLIFYFLLLNEKFLYCLTFFLISFIISRNKKLFTFISIVTLLYLSILFFIYLSSPFDFYFHLNSSAARVIKSLSFLLAFFGLYNLVQKYYRQ